ncbi:hypothetical protein REPUB_Repub10bG0006800 [Reevesia pubescens]
MLSSSREVPIHRCILLVRSSIFKYVFSRLNERGAKFELKELTRDYEIGYNSLVAVLAYLYTGKVKLLLKDVWVCVDDDCSHRACRPAIDFMAKVLYAAFTFQVSELIALYQEKCIKTIVKSDVDIVTHDKALPYHIVKQVLDSRLELGLDKPENIDEAYALHYAVAYYDAKTMTELLDLGLANFNRRNSRGYTVLHVAVMTKEPKIIVSLLTKGARSSDLTLDCRKALQISKRLTKAVDYYISIEEGKASPNDRLCIESSVITLECQFYSH